MASKLYIGGLSYSTTSDGLREYFAQSGNVLSADRKSTRLNSSHLGTSYAVFCLKKKNNEDWGGRYRFAVWRDRPAGLPSARARGRSSRLAVRVAHGGRSACGFWRARSCWGRPGT